MIFEVNPVLMGVLESVDNPGGDDRILNRLICLFFEIFCEKGVRLDGRSDTQQFLGGMIMRTCPRE